MGNITLITGGTRSGKSDFALELAENTSLSAERIFVATCPKIDDEINERIRKHQEEREGHGWITVEEQLDIYGIIEKIDKPSVVLIDCMTLWVNNLLYNAEMNKHDFSEQDMVKESKRIVELVRRKKIELFCVTNEVGMGIVPADKKSRYYRDLVGKCNKTIATLSDNAFLVSCGIPLKLK